MTSANLPSAMRPEQAARILRNTAAVGLARSICGEPIRWEDDAQLRIESLPVDELPWHGVVVWVGVTLPLSGATVKAPFLVWMADGDPVYVHALLEDSPDEAVFALMDAMMSPVLGAPRRPRVVCVEQEAVALAFRRAKESVGHDLAALVDVRVGRDIEIAELAREFVQIHAETQVEEARDADAN